MHHVRKQYNRWSFRLSIFGKYVDAGESYEDEVSAGLAADLVKHYLRTEFKLDLTPSLDEELFSSLAYSRRGVDLSDSLSVASSMPEAVKSFINEHGSALISYRDSQPAESVFSKFRRCDAFNLQPEIRDWVLAGESAEEQAKSFSAINGQYFFSLLDSLSNRLTGALGPLQRAVKMHERVEDELLVDRAGKLRVLLVHMKLNLDYVKDLTADLRAEQASVESAVSTLEANRPNLS